MEFTSFVITLPYPSVQSLMNYMIIGALMSFFWFTQSCFINNVHISLSWERRVWIRPMVVMGCWIGWPILLASQLREAFGEEV